MKFGKIGTIIGGEYDQWKITAFSDDTTGGYYVLIWAENKEQGYDDWFETSAEAEQHVNDNYVVAWTEENYTPVTSCNANTQNHFDDFVAKARQKGFFVKLITR